MYIWFTMGPSTDSDVILEQALLNGSNGCRLTFSYGTPELQKNRALRLKAIAQKIKKKCFIVADLAGEKFRLSSFESSNVEVKPGEKVTLSSPEIDSLIPEKRFSVNNQKIFNQVAVGERIVIGDGSLILEVYSVQKNKIVTQAINMGIINPNRGIIIQGRNFNPLALTSKDIEDLEYILEAGVFDAVAISFVSSPRDIKKVRKIMMDFNRYLPIIAKIETMEGLENLNEIAAEADLIMAARGDLALAMPWVELPAAMNKIQKISDENRKPWILATQLVEGIERFAFPTRAEICDLANWLSKGVSGVMLSYETAFGKKPVEAITAVVDLVKRWGQNI